MLDTIRTMAAAGMTRAQMSRALGIDQNRLDRALRVNNIKTHGRRGVPAKPKADPVPVHGCGGEKPAKLMPSEAALARVSVWNMASV